jgi:hypothetical protein
MSSLSVAASEFVELFSSFGEGTSILSASNSGDDDSLSIFKVITNTAGNFESRLYSMS